MAVTSIAVVVLANEYVNARSSIIKNKEDLAGRKVCAVESTAPFEFLQKHPEPNMKLIEGIKDVPEMFW